MNKYSPGPWIYMEDRLEVHSAERIPVADIRCSHVADEAIEANARLIAAAPDLLSALKRVLSSIPISVDSVALDYDVRDAARIIAKAEGRE